MRIGQLADLSGTTAETIRYYEKIGLLPPPDRGDNNYRNYGSVHVNRLDFIRHCRNLDIGLSEIQELLSALESKNSDGASLAHRLIHRHLAQVDERINDLLELKGHLEALEAHCRGDCNTDSCGILQGLADGSFEDACAKGGHRHTVMAHVANVPKVPKTTKVPLNE